jgi:hypothetical protein
MKAFTCGRTLLIRPVIAALLVVVLPLVAGAWVYKEWKSGIIWPEPPVVTSGEDGSAPSDAIVLFDGSGVDQWKGAEKWLSEDGVLTATKGPISTKQKFGSCQLHLEFMSPEKVEGKGQGRGNSGVFFGDFKYEVQVLDSFENQTYFDGQCGAIYKQAPPIVNPCRKPGQWQTYDIIYGAPEFGGEGKLIKPAYLTVLLNGVLVQNHVELKGNTFFNRPPSYTPHESKQPIGLQFHKNPVKFRNIWVRENVNAIAGEQPE